MGKARIATPALLERIERVCRMRLAAEQIPSDAQLALSEGVSRRLIRHWVGRIRRSIIAGGQPDQGKGGAPGECQSPKISQSTP